MFLPRSRVDEANPVVTGRADAETANTVFPGWRTDEDTQRAFNPFVELTEARALRDKILHKFLLKPGHITGVPTKDLAVVAQTSLMAVIITERGWPKQSIERYFGVEIPDDQWRGFYTRIAA
jgi:hypothetical protein